MLMAWPGKSSAAELHRYSQRGLVGLLLPKFKKRFQMVLSEVDELQLDHVSVSFIA